MAHRIRLYSILLLVTGSCASIFGQESPKDAHRLISPLTREYRYPTKIIWSKGQIRDVDNILIKGDGQASLTNQHIVHLRNSVRDTASILLDFGKEIHGAVEIVTGAWAGSHNPRNIRIRLGESVSEAMSEIGDKGATNDHAMRDFNMQLPWLGKNQTGESGFRFVRIDFLDRESELQLREVRAIATYRDVPYLGSFKSNDERLNKIWEVGAYTVHLNMQDYLWDGIKRDRLVWVGDLHPEVATVNAVFGYNDVVPKSLDLARDATPLPGWMCGISTYSMWWIVLHHDWYMHHGHLEYLKEQGDYLKRLVAQISSKVVDGKEQMDGFRFLDWPSSEDSLAVHAGLQAMTILALEKAAELSQILGDKDTEKLCNATIRSMRNYTPKHNNSKQAASLMSLVGLMKPKSAYDQVISVGGAQNFSTFYGYYMLEAMAKADRYQEAMDIISQYWGAMLDLGATTFWEDFNLQWIKNASRIDEIVLDNKVDIHGDFGDYCYVGHRHSLCHGWASGPTAWLSEHVLGVKVLVPAKKYTVSPHLGELTYVEGTYPTPFGEIWVKHTKSDDGKITTEIKAPKELEVTLNTAR
ncbi:alpha-L-rhamnosidase [Sphingobacterium sp. LRF_L2]|uniref:alpha-L-rhamnosidase-related protein n=1 Tax=Sphingobacterium sp. LRF_L2 TaxID=3369421 RepID=UPI003F5E4BA8